MATTSEERFREWWNSGIGNGETWTVSVYGSAFQAWHARDAEVSTKDARIAELESIIREIYPYIGHRTDKFLIEWKTRAYHALNSQLEKPDET